MIRAISVTGRNNQNKQNKFVHFPAPSIAFCLNRDTVGWSQSQRPWGQRRGKALTSWQLEGLTYRTVHIKGQFKVPNL